jgi:hypothetical protein
MSSDDAPSPSSDNHNQLQNNGDILNLIFYSIERGVGLAFSTTSWKGEWSISDLLYGCTRQANSSSDFSYYRKNVIRMNYRERLKRKNNF